MAAVKLVPEDLTPFAKIDKAKAEAMIEDAVARAAMVAPCILDDSFAHEAAAKAILRGAILRWHEAGNGALTTTQVSIDDYNRSQTYDTRGSNRGLFWPTEIQSLQSLCQTDEKAAFSIDRVPVAGNHAETCSIVFGANYCDCGAVIAGYPIFGGAQ